MLLPKQIRFWDWLGNGKTIVQLKLHQGEEIRWRGDYETDEGYYSQVVIYTWYRGYCFISREVIERGLDCEGRYAHGSKYYAKILQYPPYQGIEFPVFRIDSYCGEKNGVPRTDWKRIDEWERDYAAEAMGY